jgi:hypothetical protein
MPGAGPRVDRPGVSSPGQGSRLFSGGGRFWHCSCRRGCHFSSARFRCTPRRTSLKPNSWRPLRPRSDRAGLIASDRRANALQLYLARPVTPYEYVGGKLAVLVAFLLFVTGVPALTLLLLQVLFAGSFEFLTAHWRLVPAILAFSALQSLTVGLAMLALSSLSTSSRYVGILYAALLFFVQAVTLVLRGVTGHTRLAWLSVASSLEQIGHAMFGVSPAYEASLGACLLSVLVVMVTAAIVLDRRVRGIEVVA